MIRFVLFIIATFPLFSAYTVKEGKLMNVKEVATLSVQEHYSLMLAAEQNQNWEEMVQQARLLAKNFPSTPFAQEANFYLGVGYFQLSDFEYANRFLSRYLKSDAAPKFFLDALQFKVAIAQQFQHGAKMHLFGVEKMPKWVPAEEKALDIYEQVIASLPNHDLAAQALYGRATLLAKLDDYKPSIEAFQTLLRRFPKHSLSSDSYLAIGKVYLQECQKEFPDPDFLDLALINLRKFKQDFPLDERIPEAEKSVAVMQEIYAKSLYETGKFYERTKKPHAALIYYHKVVEQYPDTKIASLSKQRVERLAPLEK